MREVPEVSCMRCRHHAITHELPFRYRCDALGFKSARLPCKDVLENSGLPCQYFVPRQPGDPLRPKA